MWKRTLALISHTLHLPFARLPNLWEPTIQVHYTLPREKGDPSWLSIGPDRLGIRI